MRNGCVPASLIVMDTMTLAVIVISIILLGAAVATFIAFIAG
jgi:hypothetical protein